MNLLRMDGAALAFYFLCAFGLAYILGFAKITLALRANLDTHGGTFGAWCADLLECPACLGFWIGLSVGWLDRHSFAWAVQLALATTASNLLLALWSGLVDRK